MAFPPTHQVFEALKSDAFHFALSVGFRQARGGKALCAGRVIGIGCCISAFLLRAFRPTARNRRCCQKQRQQAAVPALPFASSSDPEAFPIAWCCRSEFQRRARVSGGVLPDV